MPRYRYIYATALCVTLAACAVEEVRSPMPEISSVQDEKLFHCGGDREVRIIHEEILGNGGEDPGHESVILSYEGRALKFDSQGNGFVGPWQPAFEYGFSLKTYRTDDPTQDSIELRDKAGRVVIGNCRLDLHV